MASSVPLTKFKTPPVTQVALAVQWEPIPMMHAAHLGMVWERYRDMYPDVAHQTELPPMAEHLGLGQSDRPNISFGPDAPGMRLLFGADHSADLIQVQADRFVRNWRRIEGGQKYPGYSEHIRPGFVKDLKKLLSFLEDQKITPWKPNLCEISYVNTIGSSEFCVSHSQIGRLFNGFVTFPQLNGWAKPEHAGFGMSYTLDDNQSFVGRLHINCAPSVLPQTGEEVFNISLTVRGRPFTADLPGALSFLDMGRSYIVNSFTQLTSSEAHEAWGVVDE